MSVIAVKIYKDRIEAACDSIIVKDDLKRSDFLKLRKINDLLVGGCGTAEELCLMFNFAKTEAPKHATTEYIQEYMRDFSFYVEKYTGERKVENVYILAYGDKVFEIDGMFVQEIESYTAIGEGEPYSLTALELGKDVKTAVKVACKFSCYVSEPVVRYTLFK